MTDVSPLLPGLDPIFPLDRALLADGAKRVALVLAPTSAGLAAYAEEGWTVALVVGGQRIEPNRCDEAVTGGADVTAFAGREADVEMACALDRIAARSEDLAELTAVAELQRLLGHPACCIAAHLRADDWSDAATLDRLLPAGPSAGLPMVNNFFVLEHRLIAHFPCALDCEASARAGRRALTLIDDAAPERGTALRPLLRAPIHVWDRRRFVIDHPEAGPVTACRLTHASVVLGHPTYRDFEAMRPELPDGGWRLTFDG